MLDEKTWSVTIDLAHLQNRKKRLYHQNQHYSASEPHVPGFSVRLLYSQYPIIISLHRHVNFSAVCCHSQDQSQKLSGLSLQIRNIRHIGIWTTDIWVQTSVRDLAYSEIILYHLIKSPHLTKKDISIFNVKASCEMNRLFLIPVSNSSWATWAYIWEICLNKDPCWGLLLYKMGTVNT